MGDEKLIDQSHRRRAQRRRHRHQAHGARPFGVKPVGDRRVRHDAAKHKFGQRPRRNEGRVKLPRRRALTHANGQQADQNTTERQQHPRPIPIRHRSEQRRQQAAAKRSQGNRRRGYAPAPAEIFADRLQHHCHGDVAHAGCDKTRDHGDDDDDPAVEEWKLHEVALLQLRKKFSDNLSRTWRRTRSRRDQDAILCFSAGVSLELR